MAAPLPPLRSMGSNAPASTFSSPSSSLATASGQGEVTGCACATGAGGGAAAGTGGGAAATEATGGGVPAGGASTGGAAAGTGAGGFTMPSPSPSSELKLMVMCGTLPSCADSAGDATQNDCDRPAAGADPRAAELTARRGIVVTHETSQCSRAQQRKLQDGARSRKSTRNKKELGREELCSHQNGSGALQGGPAGRDGA